MDTDFRTPFGLTAHTLVVPIPMPFQRRDRRTLMITPGRGRVPLPKPRRNETLIKLLVRRPPVAGTPKSIFQPIAPA
jgi:hypothetical protein